MPVKRKDRGRARAKSSKKIDRELQEEVGRVVGQFAHAMKSALQGIVNVAEELHYLHARKEPGTHTAETHVDWAKEIIDRCYSIRLLASNYSMSDTTTSLVRHRQDVRLAELCRASANHFFGEAGRRLVRIQLSLPSEALTVTTGEPELLEAAIANLLDNAVKYSLPRTTINVDYSATPSTATIAIESTGVGIPSNEINDLFKIYRRGERKGQSYVPGSGIGLYVVERIARQHSGRVHCTSTPLEGDITGRSRIRFELILPTS